MTAQRSHDPIVIGPLFGLLWKMQMSRTRLAGLFTFGCLTIVLIVISGDADDIAEATAGVLAGFGLGIAAAICSLWVASATLGNLVDDRLLIYLWIKPTARWQLPVAAVAASLAVLSIVVIVPVTIAAIIAEVDGVVAATVVALVLTCSAYSAVFVAAGLILRRALWWGLMYILIWENFVARFSAGTARLSILNYGQSFIAEATDTELNTGQRSSLASWAVPIVVTVTGIAVATWRLQRTDVD